MAYDDSQGSNTTFTHLVCFMGYITHLKAGKLKCMAVLISISGMCIVGRMLLR